MRWFHRSALKWQSVLFDQSFCGPWWKKNQDGSCHQYCGSTPWPTEMTDCTCEGLKQNTSEYVSVTKASASVNDFFSTTTSWTDLLEKINTLSGCVYTHAEEWMVWKDTVEPSVIVDVHLRQQTPATMVTSCRDTVPLCSATLFN